MPEETTYYNFEYEEELRRGLAYRENLFSPGYFCLELSKDTNFAIAASTWRTSMVDWVTLKKKEEERLQSLMAPVPELAKAADAFLVKRGNSLSLIAGYHWFDDWGRDAMIALPGLLLTTGRFREAKSVLKSFADSMIDGVLPNDLGGLRETLEWIRDTLSPRVTLSVMTQYYPAHRVNDNTFPLLNRRIRPGEYEKVLAWIEEFGFENGWIQPLEAGAAEYYRPDFADQSLPFRDALDFTG